jgi:hypothetical protein
MTTLTKDQIREIFMAHGFTVKEGQTDLKQYVYDAALALLSASKPADHSQCFDSPAFCSSVRRCTAKDAAAPAQSGEPDDLAVDRFAAAMKDKMAAARAKGRGGWEKCSPEYLTFLLREHVEKGDPRDVANFCMMLWHLESRIFPLAAPLPSQPVEAGEACAECGGSSSITCKSKYCPQTTPSAVVLDDERAAETKCTQCCGLGYYRGKWPFDWSVTCEICQGKGQVRAASPQATLQDAAVSVVQAIAATKQLSNLVEAQATATQPAQTSPYLPCPICKGVEGCDHTVPERARAAQTERALTDEQPEPRYRVLKASGSRYAYVIDTVEGGSKGRYDVLKGNGWTKADKHAATLNAAQPANGGNRE